mmetsp:Transcript_15780/g.17540  ORF Transcript_15780/g.17540 Transcript_15780/m.17540 type:complete len:89 (+) Transcript_15780:62-328(+)
MSRKRDKRSHTVAGGVAPALDSGSSHIQQDYNQREEIGHYVDSIKKIVEFLNMFEVRTRAKLARINTKLTVLENRMLMLEHMVSTTES